MTHKFIFSSHSNCFRALLRMGLKLRKWTAGYFLTICCLYLHWTQHYVSPSNHPSKVYFYIVFMSPKFCIRIIVFQVTKLLTALYSWLFLSHLFDSFFEHVKAFEFVPSQKKFLSRFETNLAKQTITMYMTLRCWGNAVYSP